MRLILCGLFISLVVVTGGCAAGRTELPYPAFVQADELPDVFLAALPGVRAKQFAGDPQSRRSSNRVQFPADWSGTSGASPGKSLELYVLSGEMRVGDMTLASGGYAFFPPGFTGANLSTSQGATLLYFLNDANPDNIIQTPIINSSELLDWRLPPGESLDSGLSIKELRSDPGSGARTWLLRVAPHATAGWQKRSRVLEGYLVAGRYRGSECSRSLPVSDVYEPGGYFHRPAGVIAGGPKERALETSIWLLRTRGKADPVAVDGCALPAK